MKKRFLLVSIVTLLLISITIPVFAMDNVVNGIRNFVGGTENVIENVGNNVSNGVKSGLNTVGEGTQNVMTDVRDGMDNAGNTMAGAVTDNNNRNDGYTATRTSSDDVTVAGMTSNTWTWIIVAITIVAIGILI